MVHTTLMDRISQPGQLVLAGTLEDMQSRSGSNPERDLPAVRAKEGSMTAYTERLLSAGEITSMLCATLMGPPDVTINDVQTLEMAGSNHLSFVGDEKQLGRLNKSRAIVIIAPESARDSLAAYSDRVFILVPEPEPAFLSIAAILNPARPREMVGVSERASVPSDAEIGANTNIHPFAVIGRGARIGRNCDIRSGVVVGDDCIIGDHVVLHPNTVLYADVQIGSHVTIHAACVIGADGFGYRQVNGGHQRLPHFGTVIIKDDVEIGAATTIDRAKVGATIIGEGTRIDNQVMIGHNCRIGRHNLIVAQSGFAGTASTGDYVVCAGQVGVADHVHIGTGARLGAKTGAHKNLRGGRAYLGMPAAPIDDMTRQMTALRRLPSLRNKLRDLEKEVEKLQAQINGEGDKRHRDAA